MGMYSTKVSLTDPQITVLRAEAERLGISVADVIRRALDEWRAGKVAPIVQTVRLAEGHEVRRWPIAEGGAP